MLPLTSPQFWLRSWLRTVRDGALGGCFRLVDRIVAASQSRAQRARWAEHAITAPTSRILPEAIVRNLAGDRRRIRVGEHSYVRGELLVFSRSGTIQIGQDCYVGDDTRIWSAASVRIGDRVLISHGVNIHDTNSHPVDAERRHAHFLHIVRPGAGPAFDELREVQSAPVTIGDDAWIGFQATILKGITVGSGAIIAACAVVTKDVPPRTLVAGNPAEVIRQL